MNIEIIDNHKYFLEDGVHYFLVRDDEYDKTVRRVLFYKGDIYLANEKLMNRTLESLQVEFEKRRSTK